MTEFAPVTTITDLMSLSTSEMYEGYLDGRAGEPEPGNNRSRSYWHGWRNGAVDGRHREKDSAQAELARVVVAAQRDGGLPWRSPNLASDDKITQVRSAPPGHIQPHTRMCVHEDAPRFISCVETAKLVRAALKLAFRATSFRVRSSTYANGASIHVIWKDGPDPREVRQVTSAYEGVRFDGMIDLKYRVTHHLMPDGTATLAHDPGTTASGGVREAYVATVPPESDSELVQFGADYVLCHRARSVAEGGEA